MKLRSCRESAFDDFGTSCFVWIEEQCVIPDQSSWILQETGPPPGSEKLQKY